MDAKQDKPDRRRLLKIATLGGIATTLVLPSRWVKPVVKSVIVPAHAAASGKVPPVPKVPLPPSDVRLKEDITPLMQLDNGIGLYRYRYKWDRQVFVGVMAQEVADIVPNAVLRGQDGYLRVDYGQLGLSLMTWDEWVARNGDKPRLMQ
jgi:Chaperone of endosialidase